MKTSALFAFLAAAALAAAQPPQTFERHVEVTADGGQAPAGMQQYIKIGRPGGATIEFVSAEFGLPGKLVKGAPYTAEAVTETVQTLADGNRIVHRSTSQVARDGEGRTRRQDQFGGVGPWAAEGGHEVVFIHDPVAKLSWVLEADTRTARKMPLPPGDLKPGEGVQMTLRHTGEAGGRVEEKKIAIKARLKEGDEGAPGTGHASAGKTESLGKRNIEGVIAEGTRYTLTIPAGQMGNERPIEAVTERWYSPELQLTVMSRNSDPRFGETTYRLTGIVRSEPPRSLFEVPPDYKVVELKGEVKIIRETKP
jgi:hypothetical protein